MPSPIGSASYMYFIVTIYSPVTSSEMVRAVTMSTRLLQYRRVIKTYTHVDFNPPSSSPPFFWVRGISQAIHQ